VDEVGPEEGLLLDRPVKHVGKGDERLDGLLLQVVRRHEREPGIGG